MASGSHFEPTVSEDPPALDFQASVPQPLPRAVTSTLRPRRDSVAQFLERTSSPQQYSLRHDTAPPAQPTPRPQYASDPQWHIPIYENSPTNLPERPASPEEFPARRISQIPLGPTEVRRGSDESDLTLHEYEENKTDPHEKYSLSSYQHPYDIPPPQSAYPGSGALATQSRPLRSALRRGVSFAEEPCVMEYQPNEETIDHKTERALKRRGIPSNMMDLFALNNADNNRDIKNPGGVRRQVSDANSDDFGYSSARPGMRRLDSMVSMMSGGSDILDPDDPRVTGVEAKHLEDSEDIEKNVLRQMDYRARRKHLMRIKIEFNVTCVSFSFG